MLYKLAIFLTNCCTGARWWYRCFTLIHRTHSFFYAINERSHLLVVKVREGWAQSLERIHLYWVDGASHTGFIQILNSPVCTRSSYLRWKMAAKIINKMLLKIRCARHRQQCKDASVRHYGTHHTILHSFLNYNSGILKIKKLCKMMIFFPVLNYKTG